jgi:hypothetical protein
MKRHPADFVSFVFGIVFVGTVGVASAIAIGGWETSTAGAWLIPTAVILLGVGILVATLRGTNRAED